VRIRVLALSLAAALVGLSSSCGPDIGAGSPMTLSALDPELLTGAQKLIFSFSTTKGCKDLMDLDPAAIGELLADENPPLQLVSPSVEEHVFGKVEPNERVAYFVLASSKSDFGQRVEFAELKGTVFAMGCRELEATSGKRHDLPLTLFPVGLR
jgi:hypothetical protein